MSPASEIRAGQSVLLRCGFSGSNPEEVRFFWKKNGSLVQEGRDLSFSSISPEDSGDYNCLVSNSVGETASQAWSLRVLCECCVSAGVGAKYENDEVTLPRPDSDSPLQMLLGGCVCPSAPGTA